MEQERKRERRRGVVCPILYPSTFIYRTRRVGGAPLAAMGATYRVVTRGAEEWGSSCCILREKELEAASFLRKLLNLAV
jgi:hypothetical protein